MSININMSTLSSLNISINMLMSRLQASCAYVYAYACAGSEAQPLHVTLKTVRSYIYHNCEVCVSRQYVNLRYLIYQRTLKRVTALAWPGHSLPVLARLALERLVFTLLLKFANPCNIC